MSALAIPPTEQLYTAEELDKLSRSGRYELIDGRLVEMAPTGDAHGGYEGNVFYALRRYVEENPIGKVRVGEVGLYLRRNPDAVRAADALFISHERHARRRASSYLDVPPELVVEVLLSNDAWADVMQKLRDYLGFGVNLVWIIDPSSKTVHAYRSMTDVQIFEEHGLLNAGDVLPGFSVPVAEIFAE
jgi:Uma2 family endonuclease